MSCHPRAPPGEPCRTRPREAPFRIPTFRAPVGARCVRRDRPRGRRGAPPPQPRRASCALGRITRVTGQPGLEIHPALSPDGKFVAYAAGPSGRLRIYVRQLSGGRTIAVADSTPATSTGPAGPRTARGSASRRGGRSTSSPRSADPPGCWSRRRSRVPASTAKGRSATRVRVTWPGRPMAGRSPTPSVARIEVRAAEGGPPTTIAEVGQPHSFAWSPDGSRIAYVLGNAAFVYAPNAIGNIAPSAIWTVAASGRPAGAAHGRGGAQHESRLAAGRPEPAVRLQPGRQPGRLPRRHRSVGHGQRARRRGSPPACSSTAIDLSRDGRQLAYADFTEYANVARSRFPLPDQCPRRAPSRSRRATSRSRAWRSRPTGAGWRSTRTAADTRRSTCAATGGEPELLSPDSGDAFMPSWSPDGREIAYYGFRAGPPAAVRDPRRSAGTPSPVVVRLGQPAIPRLVSRRAAPGLPLRPHRTIRAVRGGAGRRWPLERAPPAHHRGRPGRALVARRRGNRRTCATGACG